MSKLNEDKYIGDTRYEKVLEQMQLLGIQDVTTYRQERNGTIVWRLPILSDKPDTYIEYASFKSGYVRNQGVDCHSNWQCNKTRSSERYHPEHKWVDGYQVKTGKFLKFETRERLLIPIEIDRLEYMMKYIIKNEFIKRANTVQQGNFVPKWKYDDKCNECGNLHSLLIAPNVAPEMPSEVTVIIDGHKYKVI